jgi:GT2 family glycosyltransferase
MLPTVTVAVLAHDRCAAVRTTLSKILHDLDYPSDRLDVILVDNASADGTVAMVADEFPAVSVISLDRNVGAPGWNAAFAVASGDWVLILDDDCWIEGDALREAVAAARSQRADLVSFRVRSSVAPDWFFNDEYPTGLLSYWGCAALVSRRALQALGGYDERIFIWGNELELTMRLLDRGWRHLYAPHIVAVHMKPPKGEHEVFIASKHRLQYRNYGYVAGKLLRPRDAARVLGRLATAMVLEARVWSPRAATHLPALLAGFVRGLGAREPVRPEVSAAYRDGFVSFASPLEVLRGPWERVAGPDSTRDIDAARAARWRRFHAARRQFYPRETAVLEL